MSKSILFSTAILILALVNPATGQHVKQQASDQFAATVREVKGECFVRENEATKARKLKAGEQLGAGQEIQCEVKSRIKIRFRASGADKEIQTVRPDWFVVPNVPANSQSSRTAKVAGRRKGRNGSAPADAAPGDEKRKADIAQPAAGEFDAVDMYWKARVKRFLVVAASKTGGPDANLPFTKVDAREVSKILTRLGYEPLGAGTLADASATEENFISELQRIRTLPQNALVVVYYSGHAAADPSGKDLWLQLHGQKKFGDHYGLSIDNLLGAARGTTYNGELSVILDTCFSGSGANSTQLKEKENTVVVASSSYQQPSVSIVTGGTEMSAFTYYLIQGLTSDWTRVDGDNDGIIMYPDLAIYIGNRLTERFRDRTLLGPMQPQLVGGFSKNWVGYDAAHARNFNTEPRMSVQLERAVQLQDPSITRRMLDQISTANADSYLRALMALEDKKFDEAMTLLAAAESEGRVSIAQIHWARGDVKMAQNQPGPAREWLDKAIAESTGNQNADLIGYAAMMHFVVGHWPRAEELLKQALKLPPESSSEDNGDDHMTPAVTLFLLTMINLFQGDVTEGELYLKRLKEFDPKELEAEEEGASIVVPVLEVLSDIVQNRTESAKRRLVALRRSDSFSKASGNLKQGFEGFLRTMETGLAANEAALPNVASTAEHFQQWEAALQQRQVAPLLLLLMQTQLLVASSNTILDSKEAEDLLARTVRFAEERKDEKTRKQAIDGGDEITIEVDEKEVIVETATLLVAVGQIYAVKNDAANAEKFLKKGITMQLQLEGGATLSFGAVLQLVDLYQKARRFSEAEKELKNVLGNLREPLGEDNFYAYVAHNSLGKLYEAWNRPQQAEASYREALRLGLALGSTSIFAIEGRQALADFLSSSKNNAEASQLYEVAIRSLNTEPGRNPLKDETVGELYFSLSKSYYGMDKFQAAEKSLSTTFDIFSSASEVDIGDILDCLQWQWATAIQLKKQNEADGFYKKIVDTIEPELAKSKPDESLGGEVARLAYWYKDWDVDKSEQLFQVAITAQEKVFGAESKDAADAWLLWAQARETRQRLSSALPYLEKAQKLYQKQNPISVPMICYVKYLMGIGYYERQEFERARALLEESTNLLSQIPEENNADFYRNQWPKYVLAIVNRHLRDYKSATSSLTSMLPTNENPGSIEPEYVVASLLELAVVARLQGNNSEAQDWLARANKLLEQISADKWLRRRAKYAHERGMLALASGNAKEAEFLLTEAVSIGSKEPGFDQLVLAEFMDDLAVVLHRSKKKDKRATELEINAKQLRDLLKSAN